MDNEGSGKVDWPDLVDGMHCRVTVLDRQRDLEKARVLMAAIWEDQTARVHVTLSRMRDVGMTLSRMKDVGNYEFRVSHGLSRPETFKLEFGVCSGKSIMFGFSCVRPVFNHLTSYRLQGKMWT